MNSFDIAVVTVISFCLIRGLFKGLVGEISGIIGVVAGFYGAYTYHPMVSVYADKWIDPTTLRNIVIFFILFSVIMVVVGMIAILIKKLLNLVFLGWIDRLFGLVFGAAKGVLLTTVLFIMLTTFLPKNWGLLRTSQLSPYLAQTSRALTAFVSQNAKKDYLRKLEGLF